MTDATTPEPRTAAGRALLTDSWRHWNDPDNWRESLRLRILAIEAQARPAIASEGLARALHTIRWWQYFGGYMKWKKRSPAAQHPFAEPYTDELAQDLAAALASDAGSVGALDDTEKEFEIVQTPSEALLESAWGVIANGNGGDWANADPAWATAAERWRDQYHKYLAARPEAASAALDAERQGEQ